ncbi:hypothetical protein ACTOJ1_000403 [Shigella flexneri]
MLKLDMVSFLIRNNHRFFLGWLRQLNLFSATQQEREVQYVLEMLYKNKIHNMSIENQRRVYEKLSFTHHSIKRSSINEAMIKMCHKFGKQNYKKVISAIEENRLNSQNGFLNDILFSYMMVDKIQQKPVLQVI